MEIATWLRNLGLEQYASAFRDNGVDMQVLPKLTAEDLKNIGVTMVGHRRVLLEAIAGLREPAAPSIAAEPPSTTPDPEQPAATDAERRQVSVMFCDLVDSTALSTRLDPEELREVIGRYHACVAQTAGRFEGFVANYMGTYMGDGVLIYFGYPRAHEDDAEQAVRAGLALVDAVGELETPQRLNVRIGIATGLVVVGDLTGAGAAQEQTVVGDTPNLAARLQALAERGSVVVADTTRRQIGALFEVADLGPQSLKGFSEPQHAWRVMAENSALGRFEALHAGATPIIGRDEEIDLLLRRWRQAKTGSGRVALICAEPGIGKSRLVEAVFEQIAGEPHTRMRYFCSPHHQDSGLYPVITQMERGAGFERGDTSHAKLAKLQTLLARTATSLEDIALLAELLSLPAADIAPPPDITPQKKKEKTFEALLRQVELLSRQQPVLMVFEDIHWLDPSSRDILDRTIERLARWPVLLLATFRPEYHAPWAEQPHVTSVTLPRLDFRNTVAMVENIGGSTGLPAEIIHEIAERTDGVPLFIEELTKAVLEAGTEGIAALTAVPLLNRAVPATLQASLVARLDRLGSAAKDVAQKGAVIGREFSHDLLANLVDKSDAEFQEALRRLIDSGLVLQRGTSPDFTYIFKHALVQDVAYSTLLRSRRQQLHARIGSVLETQFPEVGETRPGLLAQHFSEAGLPERATEYWLKAGRHALARSAMQEAEVVLRRGLGLVQNIADGVRRQEQELGLQICLGQALFATQGWAAPGVGEVFARAHELCRQLDQPQKLLPILYGQWINHEMRAEMDRSQELAGEIRQLGKDQGNRIANLMGCWSSGFTSLHLGDFAGSRVYLEEGISLFEPTQRRQYLQLTPIDALVFLSTQLSLAQACSGLLDQALSRRELGIAESRRIEHAHTLAAALYFCLRTGWVLRMAPATLLQETVELLALSAERGFAHWLAQAVGLRGWCLAAAGQPAQGIPLMKAGLDHQRALGSTLYMPHGLTMLADVYRISGALEVALAHLAEAQRLAEATGVRWVLSEVLRLRGDLQAQTGNDMAADASYCDAVGIAQRQRSKLFELRSATSLARLWRDRGKRTEARELLAPIYAWFTEGFDAPDLVEAKALLQELA